ncbi:unnamed protein product, partial [Prorocentrum cordatum]
EVGKVSEQGYVEVPRAEAPAPQSSAVAAAFGGAAELGSPAAPPRLAAPTARGGAAAAAATAAAGRAGLLRHDVSGRGPARWAESALTGPNRP